MSEPVEDYDNVLRLPVTRIAAEVEEVVEPTQVWTPRRSVDLVVRRVDQARRDRGGMLRIAAKATRASAGYGTAGVARTGGAWWRWVTAAEHDQILATRPELVETTRARRRKISLWTAGVAGGGDLWLWLNAGWPLWLPPVALLALAAAVGGIAEYVIRRSSAENGEAQAARDIGTHPSGKAVRKVFVDAKLAKSIDDVKVITPGVIRDKNAWMCEVELPGDVTYADVVKKREKLAGASGRGVARLYVDPVPDHEGRVRLWSPDRDPLTGPPIKSPLIGRETPFDIWTERIYMGRSPRGVDVTFSPVGKAMLTGGEPGSGKSVADDQVLCAIALDPFAKLVLADAKRVELAVYKKIAEQYLTKPDPELYLELVESLVAEMDRRYEVMEEAGVVKITGKNWRRLDCPFLAFHTDEVQFFTTSKLGGANGPITVGLADLVGRGRAAGVFTSIATQRPAAEVVPTRLRDIMTTKLAMMCFTNAASDTILGQGMASKGYSGAQFDKDHKGAGWLHAEGSAPAQIRTGYLHKPDEGEAGDDDVRDIVEIAYRLRQAAGTLPVQDNDPDVLLLKACIASCGDAEKIWTADLLERLTRDPEWEDLANEPGELARLLRPHDVAPKGQDIGGTNRNGYRRSQFVEALNRLQRR
ncbi:FtsK/SpoIIIE domain-containing protein [Streptosporangium sp. NPDC002544]|uniref:FtsK/SpoIIIE domain-containing protein n=1 Tax=Streptosporangium sp. NPDC002544 TaxID=3154538 RepID=UPI00332BB0A8